MTSYISRLTMLNIAGTFVAQGTGMPICGTAVVLSDNYRVFLLPLEVFTT